MTPRRYQKASDTYVMVAQASFLSVTRVAALEARPGHRAFFLVTRMEEAHSASSGGAGAAPPPKAITTASCGGSHCLGYHLGWAGG
jgi:hypothetical protein